MLFWPVRGRKDAALREGLCGILMRSGAGSSGGTKLCTKPLNIQPSGGEGGGGGGLGDGGGGLGEGDGGGLGCGDGGGLGGAVGGGLGDSGGGLGGGSGGGH